MRHILELIFGKAAVVGVLSTLGHLDPVRHKIEIDANTGRETLLSIIARKQDELRG